MSAMRPPTARPTKTATKRPTKRPTGPPTRFRTPQPWAHINCANLARFDTGARARERTRDLNKCSNRTAHLASITSFDENSFVRTSVSTEGWIGLSDINQTSSSNFFWDGTSEAVGYTNWCPPTAGTGGCGIKYPTGNANHCARVVVTESVL
jgi:hypothetical protein